LIRRDTLPHHQKASSLARQYKVTLVLSASIFSVEDVASDVSDSESQHGVEETRGERSHAKPVLDDTHQVLKVPLLQRSLCISKSTKSITTLFDVRSYIVIDGKMSVAKTKDATKDLKAGENTLF
jgi:hypothetical protein